MMGIENRLAAEFAAYTAQHDPRLAELACREDADSLSVYELEEMMDRLEDVWTSFIEARHEKGLDTPDLIWW